MIKINDYILRRYASYNFAATQANLIIFNDSLNTLTSYDMFLENDSYIVKRRVGSPKKRVLRIIISEIATKQKGNIIWINWHSHKSD